MRGLDGSRAQIFSNGNAVHDASHASPDHAVMLDAQQAHSYELLRGPSALIYSAASAGGLVLAHDDSIPTAVPENGIQGSAYVGGQTGNRGRQGGLQLTTGAGPLAVHVSAAGHRANDYRVGRGWEHGSTVAGSFSEGQSGSVGVSWIGTRGFLGLSYSHQTARYGLPGHTHADCHPHGNHLHCAEEHDHAHGHGGHDHHEEEAAHENHHHVHASHAHEEETHGHEDHEHSAHAPWIDMRSKQWNVRGALNNPIAGIAAVRLQGNVTRYGHEELDQGVVGTQFRNRSHQWRLEVEHVPTHGFSGVWGVQSSLRQSHINGAEATVEPHHARNWALFGLERFQHGPWSLQAAVRHERQRIDAHTSNASREHVGNSAALLGQWQFQPTWKASLGYTQARRLPSAEELFSNGPHLATNAWERGSAHLKHETSRSWDVGVAKTQGTTTGGINVFHRDYDGYIYAQTLDEHDGYRLQQYTQSDARFTGFEWNVQHKFHRHWQVRLWGDAVRATLAGGSHVPRMAPARLGVRLLADWQAWQAHVEWVQSAAQRRVAAQEDATAGFGMLHAGVRYRMPWGSKQMVEWSLQGRNLTNRLAYAHTSHIKSAAPLQGRSLHLSMKVDF